MDKEANQLTDDKYVAIRFGLFDDDLFDFNKKTSVRTKVNGSTNYLYPDLRIQYERAGYVFVLKDASYRTSIIFVEQPVICQLLKTFNGIDIYTIEDFPFVYSNQYEEAILPLNNKLKK